MSKFVAALRTSVCFEKTVVQVVYARRSVGVVPNFPGCLAAAMQSQKFAF